LIDAGEEKQNFFGSQGVELSFAKVESQFGKYVLIGLEGVPFE